MRPTPTNHDNLRCLILRPFARSEKRPLSICFCPVLAERPNGAFFIAPSCRLAKLVLFCLTASAFAVTAPATHPDPTLPTISHPLPAEHEFAAGRARHPVHAVDRWDPRILGWRGWLASFLAFALAAAASFVWLDRPLAELVHGLVPYNPLFGVLTHLPDLMTRAMVVAVVWLAWIVSRARASPGGLRTLALSPGVRLGAAFVLTAAVKLVLKWAFGRTWPETWLHNNPSYFRDGVYGMYPFHGGGGYSAFPSGHMSVIATLLVVAWCLWPRLRPLWLGLAAAGALILVGMDFHWLADVIFGAWLGTACGTLALGLTDRLARHVPAA
jgi:membrane-associated phospholipid phosphatase